MHRIAASVMLAISSLATIPSVANADHYYRHYHRHHDRGDAVAAGIIGLAAGAIIGGALAQRSAPPPRRGSRLIGRVGDADHVAYCARRYRSYDAYSNTFIGYDGRAHQCR